MSTLPLFLAYFSNGLYWHCEKMPTSLLTNIRLIFMSYVLYDVNIWYKTSEFAHEVMQPSNDTKCLFPMTDINDPEIARELLHEVNFPDCSTEPNWIVVQNDTITIRPEAIKKHGSITCVIEFFQFLTDFEVKTVHVTQTSSNATAQTDFFNATCNAEDQMTYSNYHATIVPSTDALKRAKTMPEGAIPLNMYIYGFDTISRLMFMRKMSQTYKYITDVLNGTVMELYNIIGDGTTPALLAMLTGMFEEELPDTRRSEKNVSFVDVYPFIWNELKKMGYVTLFAEDEPSVGTFQYRLNGFKQQPTDHYLRPFYVRRENYSSSGFKQRDCFGDEHALHAQFSYVEKFFTSYPRDRLKFAFQFFVQYSHNDVNYISMADGMTVNHLKFFQENGFLNDTIIVIMTDHGARYSYARRTRQGKLEERNPFLAVILPPWFKEKNPSAVMNLRINSKRLTTPFDLHATLTHIMASSPPRPVKLLQRGVSLLSEVPASRGCSDAGIPLHWCPCLTWKRLSNNTIMARFVAEQVVQAFNKRLGPYKDLCAPLSLQSILEVEVNGVNDDYISFVSSNESYPPQPMFGKRVDIRYHPYRLKIQTCPGNGIFEVTVVVDEVERRVHIDLNLLSRVNSYGTSSACIREKDSFLLILCFCQTYIL
ncbi:hypothetical protein D918_07965 [Trichuris suis]|nr:hypothetical protein D918_07965 [Trichuris suis]